MLGKGGSSIVYHIYDPNDKRSKALKVVDLSKADGAVVEGFKNEIQLLRKLSHCKRVVRMYDYEFRRNNTQLLIVMEKGDDDLANVLKSYVVEAQSNDGKPRRLDDLLIKFYWREMLYVVQELHANNVVHSDLKPVNFIIVSGKLKLIDFGIAKAIQTNKTSVFNDHVIGKCLLVVFAIEADFVAYFLHRYNRFYASRSLASQVQCQRQVCGEVQHEGGHLVVGHHTVQSCFQPHSLLHGEGWPAKRIDDHQPRYKD